MDDLERKLSDALSRKDPPAWFEAKVLAAANQAGARRGSAWSRLLFAGRLRWVSAMAAALVVVAGVTWQHERTVREREAGEAAKAQLLLALDIASTKLQQIQDKVHEAGGAPQAPQEK